ncbi:macrophage mannose receptor 1-like isoform X1 [Sycon ciliatum]|uniref:macrophage mannose receptor 1-like isoform X1 n=1 Tax=Sycon ciliatum TaxID=27933 RepID=UPI0031F6F477
MEKRASRWSGSRMVCIPRQLAALLILLSCLGGAYAAAAVDCGAGWFSSKINGTDYCYLVNATVGMSWHEGLQWCAGQNAELASITKSAEQTLIHRKQGVVEVWIGLHNRNAEKPGQLTWVDKSAYTYTHWRHPQHVNDIVDACVELDSDGYWHAADCALERGIVCKRTAATALPTANPSKPSTVTKTTTLCGGWYEFSGYCYQYFNSLVQWSDARARCLKSGAYLVDVLNRDELKVVRALGHGRSSFWIGLNSLRNKSEYRWDDGAVGGHIAPFYNWASYLTNSSLQSEFRRCAAVLTFTMSWSNKYCVFRKAYMCKRRRHNTPGKYPAIVARKKIACPSTDYTLFQHPTNHAVYCYRRHGTSMFGFGTNRHLSWHNAAKACQQLGQSLVTISDPAENNFIFNHVLGPKLLQTLYDRSYWIGMSGQADQSFAWYDHSAVSFTNFSSYTHPRSYQQCVYITNGIVSWSLSSCYRYHPYICKLTLTPPRHNEQQPGLPSRFCRTAYRLMGGFCYYVSPATVDRHSAAKDACKGMGAHLASIHSLAEQAIISSLLSSRPTKMNAYIGLTDIAQQGDYRWDDGSNVVYTYWASGQPNDFRHAEDCVMLLQHNTTWHDVSCNSTLSYICKMPADQTTPPGGSPDANCHAGWQQLHGKCYRVIKEPKTFSAAQKTCVSQLSRQGRAGTLAAIPNHAVNFMVTSLAFGQNENVSSAVWIGLTDIDEEGKYTWTSKQPVTFASWGPGEPSESVHADSTKGPKDCVTLRAATGHWYDTDCTVQQSFVCMVDDDDQTVAPPTVAPPKQPVSSAACEPGWAKHNSICYGFFGSIMNSTLAMTDPVVSPQSWEDAEELCSQRGAHLASFHDLSTQDWAADMFGKTLDSGVSSYWIGLSQLRSTKGQYRWTDGSVLDYTHWAASEPNDQAGEEDCVETVDAQHQNSMNKGRWNDVHCQSKRPFVCAMNAGTKFIHPTPVAPRHHAGKKVSCGKGWSQTADSCYLPVTKPLAWSFAKRKCQARASAGAVPAGAKVSLAAIHNAQEHIAVARAMSAATAAANANLTSYWIGLSNRTDAGLMWQDKSPLDYLPWALGQPATNYRVRHTCVEIADGRGYVFSASECSRQHNFVCGHSRYITSDEGKPDCPPGQTCTENCPSNWIRGTDSCYLLVKKRLDFNEAALKCAGYSRLSPEESDLVTIETYKENRWLLKTFEVTSYYWIGLSGEDAAWRWASGAPVSYRNFGQYMPAVGIYGRYYHQGSKCAAMSSKGKWDALACDGFYQFICEMPVRVTTAASPSSGHPSDQPTGAEASSTAQGNVESGPSSSPILDKNTHKSKKGMAAWTGVLIGVLCTLAVCGLVGLVVLALRRRLKSQSGQDSSMFGFRRLNQRDESDDECVLEG